MPVVITPTFTPGLNAVNEVQEYGIGEGGAFGSAFTLNGTEFTPYTDNLAAMETDLQTSLDALYGSGNAVITGSATSTGYHRYTVEFQGSLAGTNVAEMTFIDVDSGIDADISTITNGSAATNGTHDFSFAPIPTQGSWTLDGNPFDWNEVPTVTGWTVTGSPDAGLVECEYNTPGSSTPELTYSVDDLAAVFAATADLISEPSTLSATSAFSTGTKTAATALTAQTSLLSATIDVSQPLATAALSSATSLLAASLTFTDPSYTAAAALTHIASSLAATAAYSAGTRTIAASLSGTASTLAASSTFAAPTFTVGCTLVGIRSILRAREVLLTSGPKVYVHGGRKSTVLLGVSTGKFKFSTGGHSSNRRSHSIHLVQVKPSIANVDANFQVLTMSPVILAGEFRYVAPGEYLIIENLTDIELTLVPDATGNEFVSTTPVESSFANGVLFSTFNQSQY